MTDKDNQVEEQPFYIKNFFRLLLWSGLVGGLLALSVPLWRAPFMGLLNLLIPPREPETLRRTAMTIHDRYTQSVELATQKLLSN